MHSALRPVKLFHCFITAFLLHFSALSQEPVVLRQLKDSLRFFSGTSIVDKYFDIGAVYLSLSQLDSAEKYYADALAGAEITANPKQLFVAYTHLGIVAHRGGRHETSLEYYYKALELAQKEHIEKWIALAKFNIGEVNWYLGNRDMGLRQMVEAEKNMEKLKDGASKMYSMHAVMGDMLYENGDFVKSRAYINKGIAACRSYLSSSGITGAEKQTALFYLRSMEYVRANLLSALDKNHPAALALLDSLLGSIKENSGNREKIFYFLARAGVLKEDGRIDEAMQTMGIVFSMLQTDSIPDLSLDAYLLRSQLHEKLNNQAAALADFKTYEDLNRNLYNEKLVTKVFDMQSKNELKSKEETLAFFSKKRKLYRWIIAAASTALLVAVLLILQGYRARKLQRKVMLQQQELERQDNEIVANKMKIRIVELEQMALRAQMNPHFIFNSLNSIQQYVINKDISGANKYISKFGELLRMTLENAAQKDIKLAEELKYITHYLEIERMRAQDTFDFSVVVSPDINIEAHYIPPMLLQPFVENSIKHGIKYLEGRKGKVEVIVSAKKGALVYTIRDNGVGRKKTLEYMKPSHPKHASKGIELTRTRISLFTGDNSGSELTIRDITDETGDGCGTEVEIIIPDTENE